LSSAYWGKYDVPVMAIMNGAQKRPGYEELLRQAFPKFRSYEAWDGVGHFLMMEEPVRFNAALEKFLDQR